MTQKPVSFAAIQDQLCKKRHLSTEEQYEQQQLQPQESGRPTSAGRPVRLSPTFVKEVQATGVVAHEQGAGASGSGENGGMREVRLRQRFNEVRKSRSFHAPKSQEVT